MGARVHLHYPDIDMHTHLENPLSAEELALEIEKHAALGWGYRAIPTGHDAMITAPEALTKTLLDLV